MKTIQITGEHGHMLPVRVEAKGNEPAAVVGRHWTAKDGPIAVVDEVADQLIKLDHAELVPTGLEAKVAAGNPYADAVSPLVPDADPTHAARALGSLVEQHPGLVALQKAGHPGVKPRVRVMPAEVPADPPTPTAVPAPAGPPLLAPDTKSKAD